LLTSILLIRSAISKRPALKQTQNKKITPQARSTTEPQTNSTSETSDLDKSLLLRIITGDTQCVRENHLIDYNMRNFNPRKTYFFVSKVLKQ
jgi:hypothetical protein